MSAALAERVSMSGAESGLDDLACGAAAAVLFAIDPAGCGGIRVEARHGPQRERWLAMLRELLPAGTPCARLPCGIDDERLLGGLDLGATLHAGRPVLARGLLADTDGGVVIVPMAERLPRATAGRLCAALDSGETAIERDGIARRLPSRIGVVALDEREPDEDGPPAALVERLAFHVFPDREAAQGPAPRPRPDAARRIAEARARLDDVQLAPETVSAIALAGDALGIASLRALLLAARAARAAAAFEGRPQTGETDAAAAVRLVLAPRATRIPQSDASPAEEQNHDGEDETGDGREDAAERPAGDAETDETRRPDEAPAELEGPLAERMIEVARAAIPPQLLERLGNAQTARGQSPAAGRSGERRRSPNRGRKVGVRPGLPRGGARLDLLATLKAALPWQRLRAPAGERGGRGADAQDGLHRVAGAGAARGRDVDAEKSRGRNVRDGVAPGRGGGHAGIGAGGGEEDAAGRPLLRFRREDFRVKRFRERRRTTTLFVVDASGSAALHRLAEAKGAVESLLAECYIRRDQVALLAFRGNDAELLLPPTRSLVRTRRSLAGLPGGGGTPLAAGIDAARVLADGLRRKGETPQLVFLSDGRANVARDGATGRAAATEGALVAARALQAAGYAALFLDTAPRPAAEARRIAEAMGARYLPLPYADAEGIASTLKELPH